MVDPIDSLTILLKLLLKQDRTHYRADYLSSSFQQKLLQANDLASIPVAVPFSSSSTSSSCSSSTSNEIRESWRQRICEWYYQVVDHFQFSREVVSIAISFLDSYLSVRAVDMRLLQLAATTTLYMAIKLYERGTLSMASTIELSRGLFTIEDIAAMECSLVETLQVHVYPPTAFRFAQKFLHLVPVSPKCPMTERQRHYVLEHARFLTELSVTDYFFVTHLSANVGLAALLNAMDTCRTCLFASRSNFFDQLGNLQDFDLSNPEIEKCRERLHYLYKPNAANVMLEIHHQEEMENEQRMTTGSPVSIAFASNNQETVRSECEERWLFEILTLVWTFCLKKKHQ